MKNAATPTRRVHAVLGALSMGILAKKQNPAKLLDLLPEILEMIQGQLSLLKEREISLEDLVVTQTLSRELCNYSVLSPLAIAAQQLQTQGKTMQRGQRVRFIYMGPSPGVHAWDLPNLPDVRYIDVPRYRELVFRAAYEVLQPLGIAERVLKSWILDKVSYVMPESLTDLSRQLAKQELPIFADLSYLHVDIV